MSKGTAGQRVRKSAVPKSEPASLPPALTALLSSGGSARLAGRLRSGEDCASQGSRCLGAGLRGWVSPRGPRRVPARGR